MNMRFGMVTVEGVTDETVATRRNSHLAGRNKLFNNI
jgi:hypothetical protein